MPTLNKSEGKLFLAIQDRSVERVYKSLKSGVNPNCLHADGWSPAAEAAYNGTNVILIMLFEAGANINIITNGHALWNVASIAGHRSTERVVFAMRDLKERPEGYLDVIEDVRYELKKSDMKEELQLFDKSLSDKTRKAAMGRLRK